MVVVEIGLNHLGSEEYLMQYVDQLASSSVDAITLQIREKEFYRNTNYPNLEIPMHLYDEVVGRVKSKGKKFGIALSDLKYVSFFDKRVDFYKILSKDLGNDEFVFNLINVVDKPIFISTGMSSYDAIMSFIDKIDFDRKKNINLIHTRLSNEVEDTNLKAIQKMKKVFDLPIAFGNHCKNPLVLYAALSFEPCAVFLYTKGDYPGIHPDEDHAILLKDIEKYSTNIKQVISSIGTGNKEEVKNTIRRQK